MATEYMLIGAIHSARRLSSTVRPEGTDRSSSLTFGVTQARVFHPDVIDSPITCERHQVPNVRVQLASRPCDGRLPSGEE